MKQLLFGGLVIALSSFTPSYRINEAINTIQDMKEWIRFDIQECRVDSIIGETYLTNLNQLENNLKQMED